jgi:hypothetical protein
MFKNIFSIEQEKLLPLIKSFSSNFYLVGGTALALQLGHRRSIDFDLFADDPFDPMKIRTKILKEYKIEETFSQGEGELTVLVDKVKITFFHYPFKIERNILLDGWLKMPNSLTIGAMKSFALGRRAKWKDYVDLYFIFQKYSFKELIEKTISIFKSEFNEKLFRTQLGYFEDIDYSETVEYIGGFEKTDSEIKEYLEKISFS